MSKERHGICECEHQIHFDSTVDTTEHRYGIQGFEVTRLVTTPYGTFEVCKSCVANGHMQLTSNR